MESKYIIALLILALALVWFLRPKKSGMAQFRGKKPEEKCLEGWTELTPEICTRDVQA